MCPLTIAAKTGYWGEVDMSKVTIRMINSRQYNKKSILQTAAWAGQLKNFPESLFNEEGLTQVDRNNDSILHIAAQNNELYVVPKNYLTEENLQKQNIDGNTVFHNAAFRGCLKDIPNQLLTDRNLAIENNQHHSCLEYALAAWYTNKKTPHNKEVIKGVELILSKHGEERLKSYAKKYLILLNEYKELVAKVEKEPAKEHVSRMVKETTQKRNLIIKEIMKRTITHLKEQESLEM